MSNILRIRYYVWLSPPSSNDFFPNVTIMRYQWELSVFSPGFHDSLQSRSLHCSLLCSCSDLWSPPREEEEEVAFAWLYQSWCLVCFGAVLSELMILKWLQVKKKKKKLNKRNMLVKVMHVRWICSWSCGASYALVAYHTMVEPISIRWGTSGSYRHGSDVTTGEGSNCLFVDNSRFW